MNVNMDMMNGFRGKRSQQEVDAQEERPFKRYRAGADEQDENEQDENQQPPPSNERRKRHLKIDHDAQMLEVPEEPGRTLKRRKTGPVLPHVAQNINQYVGGFGTNDDRSGSVYQSPAFVSQVGRVRRSSRFAYDRNRVDPLSPQHMSSINEDNDNHRNSPIAPRRPGPPQRRDIAFPTEAERTHRRNELRAMNPNQSESSEDSSEDSFDSSEDSFHDAVEDYDDSNVEDDQDSFHDTRQSPSESPIDMQQNEDSQQGQAMEDESDEEQVTDEDPQSGVMDEQDQAIEDESDEEQVTEDPQIGVVNEQEPAMEDESDEEQVTEDPQIAQEAVIVERGAFEWFQDEKGRRIRRSLRIKENERIHGGRVVYTKYF